MGKQKRGHIETLKEGQAYKFPEFGSKVGTIKRKVIQKADYETFKQKRFGDKNKAGQQRYGGVVTAKRRFASSHGVMKRLHNHKRVNLGKFDTFNNSALSGLTFAGTGKRAKSHLLADVHGGENMTENLINNSEKQNLQLHGIVEKSLNRQMETMDPTHNRKRRGSMVVEEEMDHTGEPVGRQYSVHFDAKGTKPEHYVQYDVKYHK